MSEKAAERGRIAAASQGELLEESAPKKGGAGSECAACGSNASFIRVSVSKYVYVLCRECGLTYLRDVPSNIELNNYYNTVFQVDRERQEKRIRGQCFSMLRVLERLMPDKGRLLEIGCSYGHFLNEAGADGWTVEGVEISRTAAIWAEENLGLRVHRGTLEEATPKLGEQFDAAVMFHVLEHAPTPGNLIRQVGELLRPGGVLLIRTPNASSWIAKMCGPTWEWFTPPAHIHLFSPGSIRILLERTGFYVESVTTRRGDAHNTAFELLRGMAKRIQKQSAMISLGRRALPSRSGWYRQVESLCDVIFRPFEPLEALYFRRRLLHPELLVAARVSK